MTSSDQAKPARGQHRTPCHDCPWRRVSIPGWLGTMTAAEWLAAVQGESRVECHVHAGAECAGAAIYRRNTCKMTRTPTLRLEADRVAVFARPAEFVAHHEPCAECRDTGQVCSGCGASDGACTCEGGPALVPCTECSMSRLRARGRG